MAENEGMEGKDLAIKEKKEFEQKVLEAIKDLKEGETTISIEGLEVTNCKDNYTIKLKGITFGIIDRNGNFTYNRENFREVKKALEEEGMTLEDLGLPDVEEWIDKQQEKDKQEEQLGEKERDEEDLSEEMEEEEEEKEEKKKEKDDEKQKDNNKKKNLVRLNDKIFKVLIPSTKNYSNIYLDTDKGEIVGKNKTSHEIEAIKGISIIKGANSNKPIHGMDNGEHKHVNAYRMYQIDNRPNTGFAVLRDGTEKGNFDVKYTTRKVDSNNIEDFAYVDIPLLASQTRMGAERAREVSGVKQGTRNQGEQDKVQDELDELNEEIEDVPEDIIKSFNEKMAKVPNGITNMKQFKEMLCEIVKEQLDKDRPGDFPDSHTKHAKEIVDAMVDENKGYEQAKDELYNSKEKDDDKDNGEKVMGENPRKRGY